MGRRFYLLLGGAIKLDKLLTSLLEPFRAVNSHKLWTNLNLLVCLSEGQCRDGNCETFFNQGSDFIWPLVWDQCWEAVIGPES